MLILPRRFTRQPQGNVEIDWGNPITRNLVSAFLPNQRYPFIDLASKIVDNATSRLSVRQGILGVEAFNNTSTSWSLGFTSATRWQNQPQTTSYPAISVFTLFQQFDTTSTGVIWGGGSNVTTYARFVKENTGAITFIPNSSTAGAGIITPTALNTDRPYALAGVSSFNDRELFVDGVSVASSNSAITYTNAAVLAAGAPTAAQRNIGLFCGYVWTRRLTASEIKSLTDNPWQIFRPRRLVLLVEAGGAVTHATTGALTGQGSALSGSASRFRAFATSGTLVGPGSSITGSAARAAVAVSHDTTGVLTGPGALLVGAANHISLYPDPADVREGVQYGPGGIYVGTLTGGGGSTIIRLRSFTERH